MSAFHTPRTRRVAGHRPSGVAAGRPRKAAESRRETVAPVAPVVPVAPVAAPAPFQPRRRTAPLVAAAAAVLVAVVVVTLLAWDLMRMDDRADARKAAQVVATESVAAILSYDHARYDEGVAAAKTLMTDEFAEEYADTVDTVRPEVLETESVVKAEVVASSVVEAEADEVRALLFVNQTTTGKQVAEPRVDLNRVEVTLVRDPEVGWLVSDIEAL
jgi:Mce-associated membrane protein